MQSQFNALGLGDLNQRLSLMRGIEFVVHVEYPPDMWIIRKQRRNSPEDGTALCLVDLNLFCLGGFLLIVVVPLAYYYVVNENIYPSSDIYSIFASRLVLRLPNLTPSLAPES